MKTIGNRNNVFKVVELSAGYKHLTTPRKQTIPKDAVNEILRENNKVYAKRNIL